MVTTELLRRHARARGQPLTDSALLDGPGQVREVLRELTRTGVVSCYDKGPATVYAIARGKHLAAAFYRNTMLHFVLDRAIAEMAVMSAAEQPPDQRQVEFWEAALRLREGLKFEFFFRERPLFEQDLEAEMARIAPDWRALLERPGAPLEVHRAIFGPGIAHAVLRPFLESQLVVADALLTEPLAGPLEERGFIDKCQKLGRQYLLQRKLRNPESVSKPLFQEAVKLARNLRLVEGGPELAERRAWYAGRLAALRDRLDAIERSSG